MNKMTAYFSNLWRRIKYEFEHIAHWFKTLTVRKFLNSLKTFFSKPQNIILIIFVILLAVSVIVPLVNLVFDSFKVHSINEQKTFNETWNLNLKKGDMTWCQWPALLANFEGNYSVNVFYKPLGLSMLMAVVACLTAVVVGGVLAWFITRSNIPFKKYISTVFIFPYIMPSWSIAMFWENFFKNSQITACNFQVGMLQSLTGICVPEWLVYGFWPCAFVLGIHYSPFAYILIGGILRNMDANLEEAATILKASRFKILRRITVPIVAPAIISTILLVFSSSISSYTVPAFLNKNGSFNAISQTMRGFLMTMGDKGKGMAIAVILLIISVIILLINNHFTSSRRSFTTVSGKSGQVTKVKIGGSQTKWVKWIVATVLILFVTFFAVFPLITFILESLEENSGDLSTLTFKYWITSDQLDVRLSAQGQSAQGILHNWTIWAGFGRSILVSICVALLAGSMGILIGYAVSKNRKGIASKFVSNAAFLPYLIPALSFGAMFFSISFMPGMEFLCASGKGGETGAVLICIMAGAIKFLPFASRSGTNSMLQLSGEIEEAAVMVGCPWWKRMTKILFPIQKSSFISCYLLPFISCMRELTLFVLLTTNFTLITNVLQYFDTYGLTQISNGINLLIVVFVIAVNLLVNKLTGASIDKGIGG